MLRREEGGTGAVTNGYSVIAAVEGRRCYTTYRWAGREYAQNKALRLLGVFSLEIDVVVQLAGCWNCSCLVK